ncbi:unnamed protein product [Mytilus coruscus]|uniref:Novel STAND NTPase 3 domain-containing protein n=1 Tax=Mytilus coruscus TaxID=42192 RepID=A0A6J8DTV3_MYTCO|nr:unnamed protein product [Mytilus coruscus]
MLLEKELSDFSSDMYLDLIMKFNNNIEFDETNKFAEEEDLRTLSVAHLMNRLEKSLSVSVDKVEKFLHKNLEASDLIRLCHIGIEIANAKCGSNKRRSSAESDESSPNKRKSKEITAKTPIQSSIPTDLERRISEMEYSSHTGPPAEIDDNKKRWLVVGICLHSILSTTLRKYVEPVVTKLYNSLKLSDQIDKQTYTGHLKSYGAVNIKYLNYKAINNNKTTSGNRAPHYDYKVQNAVDLSKLFLEINMVHYKGFNESCDSSALLGIIVNIDKFPGNVQSAAEYVRSEIRNRWAHCNFTEWNSGMYNRSLQKIEDFINLLQLNSPEKSQTIGELNKWKTNGTNYLKDTTLGLELVNDIRQQIQLLVEYEKVICKSADTEFSTVHYELTAIGKTLSQYDKRISTLENNVAIQEKTLLNYKSLYDAEPVINSWKKKMKLFVETDVVIDILEILQGNHCALLIGVSGMGKTITAQHIALHLWHEMEYSIVPCSNLNDIQMRYRDNVNQVFFLDDICGRYTTNIQKIENWMSIEEFVKCILVKGKTKILATCRTEVFLEEIFQATFELFNKTTYNLSEKYSFKDKLVIAGKYLKQDEEMLSATIRNVKFTPLMCFLYAQHEHFDINDFLNSPFKTFCKEWNRLKVFDKEKFCVLFLCVLYNGSIDECIVDFSKELDKDEKRKLKNIFECCNLGRDTSRSAIKDKLNACIGTYFIKVDNEYKVIHDKMFDFLCCYFGKTLIAPILKFGDEKLICERVQLESIQKARGEFTIRISSTNEQKYMDRIRMDLVNGRIHWCLNNVQMRHKEYRYKFLDVVKDMDDDVKKGIIDIKDENGINTFLISCLRGYEELVDYFISIGADVNARNGWFTPLTAACRDGHLKTVHILLDKGAMVNKTNNFGETPLYTACICGHYDLVKCLIEKHCDVNIRDKCNHTPLCVSCLGGYKNVVILLIDEGANVSECCNLLINATHRGHDDIVEMLITKGWDVNSVDTQGKTALIIACEKDFPKIVTLLIDANADIYKVNDSGETPLHAACFAGNKGIVRTLIEHNADINMLDKDSETPLHKSCRNGSVNVIQTLVTYGADINQVNTHGHTPLCLAKNQNDILDVVIVKSTEDEQIGPSKRLTNTFCRSNKLEGQLNCITSFSISHGWTPLYEASMRGDFQTVKSLITKGANVNMKTINGEPPLVAACQQGHGILIQLLIDKGADISDALFIAVQNDYDRTVKILSYKGGNLSYQTNDGKSLLTLAFQQGSIKVITFLLQKGVDINQFGNCYHLPLCIACTKGYDETVKLLIKLGANSNDRCYKDGTTPLWSACKFGFHKIVKILIENGSDLYEKDKTGKTLLHVARNFYIFQLLLGTNLDSYKPDHNGRYPLYDSMVNGNDDISDYLIGKCCLIAISERDKKTALISVFESGNTKLSRLVVSNGYTNGIINFNETILYHLYRLGRFEIIMSLPTHKQGIYDIYRYGYTSAMLADIAGNDELAEYLQTHHRDYNNIEYSFSCGEHDEIVYITERRYHTGILTEDLCNEYKYLFQACMTGQTQSLQMCIAGMLFAKRKINIFFRSKEPNLAIWFNQTPLCLACRIGHIEVVKLLLKYGAEVDKMSEDVINDYDFPRIDQNGYTPLFAACQRKYYKIVDILLEKGANVNIALYDACREGYLDTVQFLAQKGADVNSICPNGQTALYAACIAGYYTIVKFLIDRGALIDIRLRTKDTTSKKLTCLHLVYACGNLKILQLLIEKGSSITAIGILRRKLLQTACKEGKYEIVKTIIDCRINVNASDKFGTTPLLACVLNCFARYHFRGNYSLLKKRRRSRLTVNDPFLKQEGNINDKMNDNSDDELIFDDIDVKLYSHTSPRMIIKRENLTVNENKVIYLLIENGADINIADRKGRTPLSVAREIRHTTLIRMLQTSDY